RPVCQTNEAPTPPEVFAIRNPGSSPNGPGWSVRVVSNSNPLLRIEGELGRRAEGCHDLMNGVGAHEIIVETPRHDRSLPLMSSELTWLASSTWRGIRGGATCSSSRITVKEPARTPLVIPSRN